MPSPISPPFEQKLSVRSELENPKVVKEAQSQRRVGASVVGLARLNANVGIDRQYDDFTFTTASRARSVDERLDDLLRLFIWRDDLDAQLLLELAILWLAPL